LLNYFAVMKYKKLPRKFYEQDTQMVARALLGKLLVRSWRGQTIAVRINEVESYVGEDDRASHASRGRTPRTDVMYGPAGYAYVFLIYGIYHCLNVVTERTGFPAAVLIRGADSLNGPGKLTRALHITGAQNRLDVTRSDKLYIADDGFKVPKPAIVSSPRIGVDYAGDHALLPWRYLTRSEP
jgi:DNA-3-methyladenine glycosylase